MCKVALGFCKVVGTTCMWLEFLFMRVIQFYLKTIFHNFLQSVENVYIDQTTQQETNSTAGWFLFLQAFANSHASVCFFAFFAFILHLLIIELIYLIL
jgi:hypothetical protein